MILVLILTNNEARQIEGMAGDNTELHPIRINDGRFILPVAVKKDANITIEEKIRLIQSLREDLIDEQLLINEDLA